MLYFEGLELCTLFDRRGQKEGHERPPPINMGWDPRLNLPLVHGEDTALALALWRVVVKTGFRGGVGTWAGKEAIRASGSLED